MYKLTKLLPAVILQFSAVALADPYADPAEPAARVSAATVASRATVRGYGGHCKGEGVVGIEVGTKKQRNKTIG